jgi:hypothetical protein
VAKPSTRKHVHFSQWSYPAHRGLEYGKKDNLDIPEGFVLVVTDQYGSITYTVLPADHDAKERVNRGIGNAEDKIAALPSMTPEEIDDAGLEWAYSNGAFNDGCENLLREMHVHHINAMRARRGTRAIFDIVRDMTGAATLSDGTEQELSGYGALLNVTLASAQQERVHDPEAVHLTREIMEIVLANMDQTDAIVRYITDRKNIIRDIDPENLKTYLTRVHPAIGDGFL